MVLPELGLRLLPVRKFRKPIETRQGFSELLGEAKTILPPAYLLQGGEVFPVASMEGSRGFSEKFSRNLPGAGSALKGVLRVPF
jgi:hypothetical protein